MPGPFPLPSLAPVVGPGGATSSPLEDLITSLQTSYRAIYGQDIDLSNDTQDGIWIQLQAVGFDQMCLAVIAAYLSYSPTYAQGAALSSIVKINGMRRQSASFSTADLVLVGQVNTFIASGIVLDEFDNEWFLPPNITIPDPSGTITVTATCATPGAITAGTDTINIIAPGSPTGWQTATNPAIAIPGQPVETDTQLRVRQAFSTSLPALTPLAAVLAAVANVAGVDRYAIYQNDSGVTDGNGIPGHSISVIIEGGDAQAIALVIATKKGQGVGTFGTTSELVIDQSGVPITVNFFRLIEVGVYANISIRALAGFQATTALLINYAVAAAIQALGVGEIVFVDRLWAPAELSGTAALSAAGGLNQAQLDVLSATYVVLAITIGIERNATIPADIIIDFKSAASCPNGNVTTTTV